ncbi:hypothetical protein AHiyo8_13400 [Arthrobacter sp. Hiyo8]|nr:hypothetical protein AHiyo8_13400 [Arthrobacter sp. Hiyo8]
MKARIGSRNQRFRNAALFRRAQLMSAITITHTPGHGAPAGRLRLTRRGRMVFFGVPAMLLVAALLSLAGFLNSPAKAADSAAELQPTSSTSVTVQVGQSLWGLREAPHHPAIHATSLRRSSS